MLDNPFTRWRRKLTGWRVGLTLGALLATFVLMTNVALLVWAARAFPREQAGIITLQKGSCSRVRSWGQWLHLTINGLSTLLLGASNYAMQCLSSPTRKEVDRAHAHGAAMDIGLQSVKNVFKIGIKKRILWVVLALSSIPLHLLYNSVVFEAITANEYYVFFVNSDFIQGASWNNKTVNSPNFLGNGWNISHHDVNTRLEKFQQNITQRQRLEPGEAIKTYRNPYLTNRGDLLMVTTNRSIDFNSSFLGYTGASPSVSRHGDPRSGGHTIYWLCNDFLANQNNIETVACVNRATDGKGEKTGPCIQWTPIERDGTERWTCDTSTLNPQNWTILGYKPEYFLSAETSEQCGLLMSESIMIVVIVCNVCKVLAMLATLSSSKQELLVTVGDAAASFLTNPDPFTDRLCLMAKDDVLRYQTASHLIPIQPTSFGFDPSLMALSISERTLETAHRFPQRLNLSSNNKWHAPRQHHASRIRWYSTVSRSRWAVCIGLGSLTWILANILLALGIGGLQNLGLSISDSALWRTGFGSLNANMLLSLSHRTFFATPGHTATFIILANSPQLLFSFLYLLYNNIYTSLAQAAEWASYASVRKSLRVTEPKGQQRNTYWLHLPYRYAIPLLLASSLMHWLISQSLFLALIRRRTVPIDMSLPIQNSSVTCGYSVMPIIFSIVLGSSMLLFVVVLGAVGRIERKIPLMGGCSAVISACCHYGGVASREEEARKPLMWGAVAVEGAEMNREQGNRNETELEGHCTFSSGPVIEPIEGRYYA